MQKILSHLFMNLKSPMMIYKHLYEEPRLVIPFFDKSRKMFAVQGRALGQSDLRYITVRIDEQYPKIYGLDRVDISKPIYVVEGPIDSLFIENCICLLYTSPSPRD